MWKLLLSLMSEPLLEEMLLDMDPLVLLESDMSESESSILYSALIGVRSASEL